MAQSLLRRLLKIAVYAAIALVLLLAIGITLTIGWRPFIGAKARALTERKFETTPQRLERGKYLAENVSGCFGCHTVLDWSKPGAPVTAGKEGSGHTWAHQEMPWLVASNITPDKETGIGNWSDDALARAIREGISQDGRALFPIMPYESFRRMSDEDLASIIVYLRSVPPVRNQLPKTETPFPVNLLIKNAPQPIEAAVPPPDTSSPVKRGEYLVQMADCAGCHTPKDRGRPVAGLDLAGGFPLKEPSGEVASSNITPDPSGISYYNEEMFLTMMRTGRVGARQLHSTMRWIEFGKMTDEDLRAIYAYLRSLKPIQHKVDNTEQPTACKLCRQKHGLGDRN
ncbi:MAG TPA: cytochrome c [Pyrinomonadaceae bacterium]|jgi:mono/diheme cytochrome c family protein